MKSFKVLCYHEKLRLRIELPSFYYWTRTTNAGPVCQGIAAVLQTNQGQRTRIRATKSPSSSEHPENIEEAFVLGFDLSQSLAFEIILYKIVSRL